MGRYNLSDLFTNQHLICQLSNVDIIDVDMLETDFYLSRQSESFINHANEKDSFLRLLKNRALMLNCELRQVHQINNFYMDCLAFFPLIDEINKFKSFKFQDGSELNYIPVDLQTNDDPQK